MEWFPVNTPAGRIDYVATDSGNNRWKVRESIGTEPGPWRIYVNGAFKGRAESEQRAKYRAVQIADAVAAAPVAERHALLYARPGVQAAVLMDRARGGA